MDLTTTSRSFPIISRILRKFLSQKIGVECQLCRLVTARILQQLREEYK